MTKERKRRKNRSVNDATGGILGAFRDAQTAEDARYLEVLDGINEWEIAANEVVLNTQSLIIEAVAALTIDAGTRAAIKAAQEQAAAGVAEISGLTGGVQLGEAVVGLLAEAVVGDDYNELIHFPETDWIARDIARSDELRQRQGV